LVEYHNKLNNTDESLNYTAALQLLLNKTNYIEIEQDGKDFAITENNLTTLPGEQQPTGDDNTIN
jgi:hypothetical protein